jgi:hypothetical protein
MSRASLVGCLVRLPCLDRKWVIAGLGGAALSACAGGAHLTGAPLPPPPPRDTSASEMLDELAVQPNETCKTTPVSPLIVDLRTPERADLAAAMKDGLAVVAYDCADLRVLPRCRRSGRYEFVGVERSEDVIRLKGENEVRANLFGGQFGVEGQVARRAVFDLALVTVGKQRASVVEVVRDELKGDCEGATHVVRGAYVGAFALSKETSGRVQAVAQVFVASARTSSAEQRLAQHRSGDLQACRASASTDVAPPDACSAMSRLELLPVVAKASEGSRDTERRRALDAAAAAQTCAAGYLWTGDKCAPRTSDEARATCDGVTCERRCREGHVPSCLRARRYYEGWDITPSGEERMSSRSLSAADVTRVLEHGCRLRHGESCIDRGDYAAGFQDMEHAQFTAENWAKARPWYQQGCEAGATVACLQVATSWQGDAKATQWRERACKMGSALGCRELARELLKGAGAEREMPRALALYERGCDSGLEENAHDCHEAARLALTGATPDRGRAARAWSTGCRLGDDDSCVELSHSLDKGQGVERDSAKATEVLQSACNALRYRWSSCFALGERLEKQSPPDVRGAYEAYARVNLNGLALERAAMLLEKGGSGLVADRAKAKSLRAEACRVAKAADKSRLCHK